MKPDAHPEGTANQEKQETISRTRIHPDHVFGAVAQKEKFIEKGEWIYSFKKSLYEDVLTAAWLEGFRIASIEEKENRIHIKIKEEKEVYEDEHL